MRENFLVSRILLRSSHDLLTYHTVDYMDMSVRFLLSDTAGRELQLLHQFIPPVVTLHELLRSVRPEPSLQCNMDSFRMEQP